jgi:hypothetical protein
MYKSLTTIAFLTFLSTTVETSNANVALEKNLRILPSHDTFVRKDNSKTNGNGSKITVTQKGSNQRIGLVKFDTSKYDSEHFMDHQLSAYLQLSVAETHHEDPVDVKILKMKHGFDENGASWDNFNGETNAENFVIFTVETDHVNTFGQVDVSNLIEPGVDTVLAFVIEDKGHVKFHSKDHGDTKLSPSLVLSRGDDL